jgi:hypothetical protein
VMAEQNIQVGSQLEIRLRLPNIQEIFELTGTVVWVKATARSGLVECGLTFKQVHFQSHQEKITRFFADKICVLAFQKLNEFKTRPAASFNELNQAYKLIYKEYAARGYCSEKSSQMHFNHYCVLPETRTFVLSRDEVMVGTISLVPDSPCGLPMESLFPDEIQGLRDANRKLAEVSLLSLSKEEFHRKGFSLGNVKKLKASFQLFGAMLHHAYANGITDLVIAVHPKHEALYRYLSYEIIGPVRSYSGACGKPALSMRLGIKKFLNAIEGKPLGYCWDQVIKLHANQRVQNHYVWNSESVQKLFKMEPSVTQTIPEEAKAYLKKAYSPVAHQ